VSSHYCACVRRLLTRTSVAAEDGQAAPTAPSNPVFLQSHRPLKTEFLPRIGGGRRMTPLHLRSLKRRFVAGEVSSGVAQEAPVMSSLFINSLLSLLLLMSVVSMERMKHLFLVLSVSKDTEYVVFMS